MTEILSLAIILTLGLALVLATRWRNVVCRGPMATSLFTFIAILFTTGLDVGLIMFPLVDFELYASDATYAFANPLAIEFGFWGFLVWAFYFLTTFYFCIVEPRLRLFELPAIKWLNNLIIISTCAFTGYLFLTYLPDYAPGISDAARFALLALVILLASVSSTDIRAVRILSVSSTWLFFILIAGVWLGSGMGVRALAATMGDIGEYFAHLPRFVLPQSDYHQFYLFWWFSWSIMIGQFVARFASGLKAWQLLLALLIVPSIPIAIWFSVLYLYFSNGLSISPMWTHAMLFVGVLFVINSLDSLVRLYTQNLGLTPQRLGRPLYVAGNWGVLFGLVLLYQLTPLKIEWVGLLVIGLYLAVLTLVLRRREQLPTVA